MNTVKVCVNEALTTGSFPDSLKCANVRPIYKKVNPFDKNNYRPVSTLPLLSKVYERAIYEQALHYFKPISMQFCVDSTQHALFKLLTPWQNLLNKGEFVGSILMGLSEAYVCLKGNLLLAKLQA